MAKREWMGAKSKIVYAIKQPERMTGLPILWDSLAETAEAAWLYYFGHFPQLERQELRTAIKVAKKGGYRAVKVRVVEVE